MEDFEVRRVIGVGGFSSVFEGKFNLEKFDDYQMEKYMR